MLNQPMMKVTFPSLNIDLYSIFKQIAAYDILDSYNVWGTSYFAFLKFRSFNVPFITQQMQWIAYYGTNAFTGLGSATIYIFIYLFNVLIVVILKLYIWITGGKYGGQWLLEKTIKGLFFNIILSITMEGFFEFVIYSFINLYSIDLTLNGEVLGVMISSFCILMAAIILPFSLLWAIFSKDEKQLVSNEF